MIKGLCHSFDFIENLTSLTFLSLSYNTIGQRISSELRSHSLKVLVFRYNRLDMMWEGGTYTYLNLFTNLHQLEILDISYNKLQTVPHTVIDNLPRGLKKLYITFNEITFFHWKSISSLVSLTILDLSQNLLNFLPKEPVYFGSNFTFLSLESNKIQTLNQAFFSNCSTLKYLIVKNNNIKLINENSLPETLLQNLQYLDVSGNPLQCTCDAHWFIRFSKSAKLLLKHASTGLVCDLPESKHGQSLFSIDTQSCQDIYGNLLFVSTASIVAFFTLFPILKKLFWWDIWYTTQILKAAFRKENTCIKNAYNSEYDAFIVFDTQKYAIVDWVYNELVSHLEKKERKHFKLCLEERDWVAGKSRLENLCDAVYKSRRTVFVLGTNGFECGLLRHAFFMAQQRLLDEKMDVAVLVLLDKEVKMSKYLLSRKRVCKKSILHWPCNPQGQP
ncbi:toll-like receptor 7 [Pleurodeles waltl]|uniref:toll-like receptor 7 n=1 Tax=Pleurodeles waltl TaxID=8319 RepID=UPI0037097403